MFELNDEYSLCFNKHDTFLEDKPIWIATLESGHKVYQDDGRKGIKEHSAWIRLGNYIRDSDDEIVALDLKFGSHTVHVLDKCLAYYFSLGAMGSMGSKGTDIFFIVGGITEKDQKILKRNWYITPSLEILRKDEKEIESLKEPQLILSDSFKEAIFGWAKFGYANVN